MRREKLPISTLGAWAKLTDVTFLDVHVAEVGSDNGCRSKGCGLVAERYLSSDDSFDIPTLLEVPHELVLSKEAVEEAARVDPHLKELLGAVGRKSTRGDIMLFLLMQMTVASSHHGLTIGLSNFWTEYTKMLPEQIPVPTLWNSEELAMLVGTSLEVAVNCKLTSLLREFEQLREHTAQIPWCKKCWWDNAELKFEDWLQLDAWYRSRCLELPMSGEAMVPCIDMINHSSEPNAYYQQTSSKIVVLLLRPNQRLDPGSEVTISYGTCKSEAEMLFNYGFIDPTTAVHSLTLPLLPLKDDPLGKAKVMAFRGTAAVQISSSSEGVKWTSPFLHLQSLNEEDGLEFKTLQKTDELRSTLRVFWQGTDVSEKTDDFESLTDDHPLCDVFRLRAVALLQDRLREQLEELHASQEAVFSLRMATLAFHERRHNAMQLRESEASLLEQALQMLELEKQELCKSEVVMRYLGLMDRQHNNRSTEAREDYDCIRGEEDEDFS